MGTFNLSDYVTVNERVEKFYEEYPLGTIETEIISNVADKVIIKASAYRNQTDNRPCTGHAMEVEGTTFINKTSHIENCETSAVGRALAFMGYEIKKSIASQEEVETAKARQAAEEKKGFDAIQKNLKELSKSKIDTPPKTEPRTELPENDQKAIKAAIGDKFGDNAASVCAEIMASFGVKQVKDLRLDQVSEVLKAIDSHTPF